MRIAVMSDIHGNSVALDAILSDIESIGGVDETWVLGDHVALGPDPVGVLERLSKLEHAVFTRGNTDRYTVTGDRPAPSLEDAEKDPSLLPRLVTVCRSFAWTQGMVTAGGWYTWLAELPLELTTTLPDGTRLLAVHVSPGEDDGRGFYPDADVAELQTRFGQAEADLVFVGHTHTVLETRIDGLHIVNLGSVSNPLPPDLRASFAICEVDENGYRIQRRRVDYDREAVIQMLKEANHPAADYITANLRGELEPIWKSWKQE